MRNFFVIVAVLLIVSACVLAQEEAPVSEAREHAKPRVFITSSQSWEVGGGGVGVNGTWGSGGSGGARPQTAEIVKTFSQRCPNVLVNNIVSRADYVVVLEHEGGKGWFNRDNKVAVFERVSGDSIMSHSTRSLGNSVQDACTKILQHWPTNYKRMTEAAEAEPQMVNGRRMLPASGTMATLRRITPRLTVNSSPANADIEVDGNFMGNTPSSLELEPGEHDIVVKKVGYQTWQRKIKLTGGAVNLNAELQKQ